MKRIILLLALCVVFLVAIVAQNPKSNKGQNAKADKTKPKEDIRVNREYDEKGNLIKFDSTYSYSYSSDTTLKNFDFKDLQDPHGMNFNFFNDSAFNQSFFKDFDPQLFGSFTHNPDSLMNQLNKMHNFQFKNDSTGHGFLDMNEFFNQFQQFRNDSNSSVNPFMDEFNFSSKSMDEMRKMMEKQMEEMQSQHQKQLKK